MALTKISGNVVQQNNFTLSGVVTATSFTGDLTGNVTGTATTATNLADGANITTGTISNDRLPATITKNLTGDVTGNLTGNVTGNVTGTATTATNLADGANITTGTISNDRLPATITKNLTGDVTGNLTGNVSSSGANTLGSLTVTNDATVGGALTITGNLTVNGTTTTIDTVVTAVDSIAVDGDVTAGGNLNVTGVATATTFNGNLTGNVTGNVTGNLTGNLQSTASLAGISSSISDTATAIFVYDTRKDSDGGAWRKRTQHTSWYNETLNTATRGSRREFPAVAVIVATEDDVIIYDGDDPDLPMWMIFESSDTGTPYDTHYLGRGSGFSGFHPSITSVAMLNGILVVGKDGDAVGNYAEAYTEIRFISDRALHRAQTSAVDMGNAISGRNGSAGGRLDNSSYGGLVHFDLHDVAMTVLPNAPIDSATGLPVPTIAVATDDGVSVIKDDGTVVDIRGTHGGNYNQSLFVDFDLKTNAIISGFDYGASNSDQIYKLSVFPIPSADRDDDNTLYGYQHHYRRIQTQGNTTIPKLAGNYITDAISAGGDGRYAIQTTGTATYPTALNIIQEEPGTDGSSTTYPSNSRVAYITSDYNTGWLHGDIKGAFLSDTDATNVTGSELVTSWVNGSTYAYDTLSTSGSTISSAISDGSNFAGAVTNALSFTAGKKYVASFSLTINSGSVLSFVFFATDQSGGGSLGLGNYLTNIGSGNYSITFTAPSTGNYYLVMQSNNGSAENFTTGPVSVRLAEEDRSINNKGLAVYGTITKSAVATGAELVAYSGWSNSNYLVQPYNSDLNFGTGDFSTSFWIYTTDANLTGFVFDRGGPVNNTDPRFAVYIEGDAIILYTYASAAASTLAHSLDEYENQWTNVVMTRGSSGAMQIFINGVRVSSGTATVRNVTSTTNPELTIGNRFSRDGTNPLDATITLLRISGSIPSAEQIKKMYEDEKVLFQENSACTLYGSSDAVTALAYDEDLQLLHVGTSSGRSDFQGLRRINNTTTAVTTAISASNGLVAEQ
jgi:hypothetical protein